MSVNGPSIRSWWTTAGGEAGRLAVSPLKWVVVASHSLCNVYTLLGITVSDKKESH